MYTIIHPFKVGQEIDDQFRIMKKFTDEVLMASENFIMETIEEFQLYLLQKDLVKLQLTERYVYELLFLGTMWRIYHLNASRKNPLIDLFSIIDSSRKRGFSNSNLPEYTVENLNELLNRMERAGEFKQELNQFQMWKEFFQNQDPEKVHQHIRSIVIFADWFKSCSKLVMGESKPEERNLLYYVRLVGFEISNHT